MAFGRHIHMSARLRAAWPPCTIRVAQSLLRRLPSSSRAFSASALSRHEIDISHPIEEETVHSYKHTHYYPVKIGQVFQGHYRVVGKLGYGASSTAWLCRDLRADNTYVTLKVCINCSKVHRDLPMSRHISDVIRSNPLHHPVALQRLLDSFELEGPHGKHNCLVYEPLGGSVYELHLIADGSLDPLLIKTIMCEVARGLDFLHTKAHVIHSDVQPNNILMGINDPSIFAQFESKEIQRPSPRKNFDSHSIYLSRPLLWASGMPSLSDFSEARFGDGEHTDLAMPAVYRAPEVILGMPWSYPIDIWGFAMTLWDMLEPARLFSATGPSGQYSEAHHLAEMVSVLGPPPRDFISRSKLCENFWDEDGTWIADVPIPDNSLVMAEKRLTGQEKSDFIQLMRSLLCWRPEDRSDCDCIFYSKWLAPGG